MKQVTEFSLEMDSLRTLTAAVEGFCHTGGLNRDLALRVALVVEELLTNAVTHGTAPGAGQARGRLTLALEDGELTLLYEDQARPFDPLAETPPACFDPDVLARPVGGLGVHLVRAFSDRQSYRHTNGWNRLTLHKRL